MVHRDIPLEEQQCTTEWIPKTSQQNTQMIKPFKVSWQSCFKVKGSGAAPALTMFVQQSRPGGPHREKKSGLQRVSVSVNHHRHEGVWKLLGIYSSRLSLAYCPSCHWQPGCFTPWAETPSPMSLIELLSCSPLARETPLSQQLSNPTTFFFFFFTSLSFKPLTLILPCLW